MWFCSVTLVYPGLQFPPFAEAYQCKPGSLMSPVKRCHLW
jgi:hypothetical protein